MFGLKTKINSLLLLGFLFLTACIALQTLFGSILSTTVEGKVKTEGGYFWLNPPPWNRLITKERALVYAHQTEPATMSVSRWCHDFTNKYSFANFLEKSLAAFKDIKILSKEKTQIGRWQTFLGSATFRAEDQTVTAHIAQVQQANCVVDFILTETTQKPVELEFWLWVNSIR